MPLCSGDVGIGLNVRRMRQEFLSTFTVTYSLRPLGEFGTVFRRYPGQWQVGCESPHICAATRLSLVDCTHNGSNCALQVFIEDESTPGRYSLVAEMKDRPTGRHSAGVGCLMIWLQLFLLMSECLGPFVHIQGMTWMRLSAKPKRRRMGMPEMSCGIRETYLAALQSF